MTTNQTIDGVPRGLLEAAIHCILHGTDTLKEAEDLAEELRALLDAPAKFEATNKQLREALEGMVEYFPEGHSDGECFSLERAREVLALPAAQHQGEPAGFRYRANGGPWEWMDESPFADGRTHHRENGEELQPLHTK